VSRGWLRALVDTAPKGAKAAYNIGRKVRAESSGLIPVENVIAIIGLGMEELARAPFGKLVS
jgi:hypothetical protein